MNCIIPGLFLGDRNSTREAKRNGIDIIISIGVSSYSNDVENIYINISNDSSINIINELNQVTEKMNEYLKTQKILIHCKEGINRSPSVVLAYLCRYENYRYNEAIKYILSKRNICKFSLCENVKKWLIDLNPEYVYTQEEMNKLYIKKNIENSKIKKHNDKLVRRLFECISNTDDKYCNYKTEEIFKEVVNGEFNFKNIVEVFIWTDYPMVRYVLEEKIIFSKIRPNQKIKSQQSVVDWLKNKCICNIITDTPGLGHQFIKGLNGFCIIIKD